MPRALKRNAIIVLGLVALFYWSFMFAKHDQALRNVIPFGKDPYDAVGSFGVVIGMILALVSLVRAFSPYRKRPPSAVQRVYLIRSQTAVVLAVLITLAADAVAMARHLLWVGTASRNVLIALLGTLGLVALAIQLLIRASQETPPKTGSNRWPRAVIAVLLAMFILMVYPEQLINSTATHLLTVIVGAAVLFAPMRPLLTALIPYEQCETRNETPPVHSRPWDAKSRWGIVLLLGLLIGVSFFVAEMSEGDGTSPVGLLFLASIFIGLTMAGLLIAYAFLGTPLGLAPRR